MTRSCIATNSSAICRCVPKCDNHMRIGARTRLDYFLDPESQQELGAQLEPEDPLKFKDSKKYKDRISAAQKKTGEKDALVSVTGTLHGLPIVVCAFEFSFMGGSMGSVVGERFARAARHAAETGAPLISFSASGGARMQEAILSLLQMAKNLGCSGRARRKRRSLRLGVDRPDDGRRFGESCNARRRQYRGARCIDRLCRPARYRADGARAPAGGISSEVSSCWITVRST